MGDLVAVYNGSGPQHYVFHESRFAGAFDRIVHQLNLGQLDPENVGTLIVPSRMHRENLHEHSHVLESLLSAGGDLLLFGKQPRPVLPGIDFESRPTNFWWWLEEHGDSGLRFPDVEYVFFDHVEPEDCEWHFHGVFDPPAHAEVMVKADDGGAILYLDRRSYGGTLVATSLDPFYHFGSRFMPATERFLEGLFLWLNKDLDDASEKSKAPVLPHRDR